jgi:ubiquinone/menaquinone biosynthesis C-methylase UbiE
MDSYTKITKNWLDRNYKRSYEGIYFAYQPIYGLRGGYSLPGVTKRYCITYKIMKELEGLQFDSFLDVGGLEGYTAALVRSVFGASVRNCDLSFHACKKAKEIFGVDSEQVDIHQLPYKDNEFDVVLCSETLEHVADIEQATSELLRVSKKAVIITVPHEPKEVIEKNIEEQIPHAHIHSLDTKSFDFALPRVHKIISKKILSSTLRIPRALLDARKIDLSEITGSKGYSKIMLQIYNFFVPAFQVIFGKRSVGLIVKLDGFLSGIIPGYGGVLFVLLKDKPSHSRKQTNFTISQLLGFKVPYYYVSSIMMVRG